MKPSQATTIIEEIQKRWPNTELPPESMQRWAEQLLDLDLAEVMAAIEFMDREGREFAPRPAQLRAKVIELRMDAPKWGEVLPVLRTAVSKATDVFVGYDSQGAPVYENHRTQRLAQAHPVVQEFVCRHGWSQIEAGTEGGAEEARLRNKWEEFVAAIKRDATMMGIQAPGVRALERINRDSGLRRLAFGDAVAELEPAKEEEAA